MRGRKRGRKKEYSLYKSNLKKRYELTQKGIQKNDDWINVIGFAIRNTSSAERNPSLFLSYFSLLLTILATE
jgi:hypothetical protein